MIKIFLLIISVFSFNHSFAIRAATGPIEDQALLTDPNDPESLLKELGLWREIGRVSGVAGVERIPITERRDLLILLRPVLSPLQNGLHMRIVIQAVLKIPEAERHNLLEILQPTLSFVQNARDIELIIARVLEIPCDKRPDFINLIKQLLPKKIHTSSIEEILNLAKINFEFETEMTVRIAAEKLRDSFVQIFDTTTLKWSHQEKFKNLLDFLLTKDELSQQECIALADLLPIQYLTLNTALSEGVALKNSMGLPLISDMTTFQQRLIENFKIPVFSNFDKHYSKRTWKNHVEYKKDKMSADLAATALPTETISQSCTMSDKSADTLSCDPALLMPSRTSSNASELTYTFKKPRVDEEMRAIVISVYSGYCGGFCQTVSPLRLPDPTIGVIGLNLPDCITGINQWDQTSSENFEKTHVYYLRMVSNFVKYIKDKYPGRKIFLQGSSFGGFFVTSYALLQSIGIGSVDYTTLYKGFAKTAINNIFKDKKIEPINGIISYAGAIDKIHDFYPFLWHLKLTIPAFYHFNFDDDRVTIERVFSSLQRVLNNSKITLNFSRRGASDLLNDFEHSNDEKNLSKVSKGMLASTVRGHFGAHDPNISHQVVYFIRHSDELAASPVHRTQQERLYRIYSKAADPRQRDGVSPGDMQQFLSNLRNTQQELEGNPQAVSTDTDLAARRMQVIDRHMDGIEPSWGQDKTSFHEKLMNYVTTKDLWKGALQQLQQSKRSEARGALVDATENG
jgi:hypothetical protein